jgi:hypothetical protein
MLSSRPVEQLVGFARDHFTHPLGLQVTRTMNHSKDLHLLWLNQIDNSIPSFDNFPNFISLEFRRYSSGIGKFSNLD